MATQERLAAAEAYVKALSTGDRAAADAAGPHLAEGIVVQVGNRSFTGCDEALEHITGIWPLTPVYRKGEWGAAAEEDGAVVVRGKMKPVGAGPSAVNLTFTFNDGDKISQVNQENVIGTELFETDVLPDFVCEAVNSALANDIPLSVSYVDKDGRPKLSLRGSVRAYGDHSLSIWARKESGLADAVATNPSMALLYRDNPTRSTLIFQGKAYIETDDALRKQIFDETPEVERNHESWTSGAAVIIDLETADGATPAGRVRLRR